MSAGARWEIWCNAVRGPGLGYCLKAYKPPEGTSSFVKLAALRALTRKDGWTCVPARIDGKSYRNLGSDYCPDHKPQEG